MSQVILAEYGRAKTINFDLYEVDGVDFRVDAADAGADCSIMKDEGAEGTCANDFVDEGQSYSLVLTAAEMQAKRATILIVDSATKVWLDKHIYIETYGHLSSAHPFLSPYWTNGAVNDGSASSTVWTFDGFTEATADHVIGSELTFTSGANAGQSRTVIDYTSTVITVDPAFLAAPADNDEFVLKAVAQTTLGVAIAPTIGALLADVTGIAGSAMRGTDNAATAADLLDKLGAVNEAAAAGDPSTTESVMQYVKQIVNVLVGADGVVAFPAEAAPANAVSLAEVIRAIHTDVTGIAGAAMRGTDSASTLTAAQVNTEVDNAFTTQMADSVPSDGTISTREQALYAILQMLTEFAFSGTTMTVKKVDGSTTLMTFTLDDGTNPTSLTRST